MFIRRSLSCAQILSSLHCSIFCAVLSQSDCLCRLCNPYITTTTLEDTFGELAAEVAAKYLIEYEKGRYRLKDEYTTWDALHLTC